MEVSVHFRRVVLSQGQFRKSVCYREIASSSSSSSCCCCGCCRGGGGYSKVKLGYIIVRSKA